MRHGCIYTNRSPDKRFLRQRMQTILKEEEVPVSGSLLVKMTSNRKRSLKLTRTSLFRGRWAMR